MSPSALRLCPQAPPASLQKGAQALPRGGGVDRLRVDQGHDGLVDSRLGGLRGGGVLGSGVLAGTTTSSTVDPGRDSKRW
jgi:hypothetical protein